jgi:ribosome-associated heat shock protein Hsp15
MAAGEKIAAAEKVRIDKWLWAARLFKTRRLAAGAVSGGKVHVNGVRVKPGRVVVLDDELSISRDGLVMTVIVNAISPRRGPAAMARQLYTETEQSCLERQQYAEQRRLVSHLAPSPGHRPDKKQRRSIHRFQRLGFDSD